MDKNAWIIELEKPDYQGTFAKDKNGKERKVVGRNHLLLIANGFIGIRGCLSELFDDRMDSSIHVIGIYDQVGYDDPGKDIWKEIINMPDFISAPVTFDGERVFLDRDSGNTEAFNIRLDMRTAILHLEYTWRSKKGNRLKVSTERFCAYHEKNLVFSRTTLTPLDADGQLTYSAGIDGNVHDAHGPHLEQFGTSEFEGGYLLTALTQQHRYRVAISSRHTISDKAESKTVTGEKEIRREFLFHMKKETPVTITSQHTLHTSRDSMDPVADALQAVYDFAGERQKHIEELAKHWEMADVEIETDEAYIDRYLVSEIRQMVEERFEREIKYGLVDIKEREKQTESEVEAERNRVKRSAVFMRYNLYILLVSIPKEFDYAAIPSRSLSYATYKGAIFWEVDTYAFPFYALVCPEYARNILHYRYMGLEYAIKKALDLGYEGAFYAWESLDTGEEATKKFVWQDIHSGRMMRNYFGDRQWHIAGDVIYATWQYCEVTGDWDFMEDYGAQMTLLTARFIGSLVHFKVTRDRYEILHTCCPDEYHEEVANNAYTNRILRFVLEKTFELIERMGETDPEKLDNLFLQYKITPEELEYWEDVMNKLYIPEPHPETRVIEQHDGYFGLEDISLEEFRSRIIRDEYLGYPIGPAVHTQIIKQADTVQMLVMFKKELHPVVRLATFDYYDLRTEHGSGDSPNAYGIVAAQVGRLDRALWYFLRSARIDLESANPARKANFQLGGVHIAPSGGTWQVIHFGFAGFEIDGNTLRFNPVLPKGWTRISYRFVYRQQKIRVTIDREQITLESLKGNSEEIRVRVNDRPVVLLKPGASLQSAYRKMGNHYYTYNDLGVRIKKEDQ